MTAKPHQKRATKKLIKKLKKHRLAILSGEPRSGKTISSLSLSKRYKNVLVVTQKSALSDIQTAVSALRLKGVTLTNYHQVKNLAQSLKPFDLVVIDEAHRWVGGYPKVSQLWKDVKAVTKGCDMVFSSGTLTPETYANLFPMLSLSDFNPWPEYQTVRPDWRFNRWFKDYGYPYKIKMGKFDVPKYDRVKEDKIAKCIKKYVVSITRAEGGHTYEATDKLHRVELSKEQTKFAAKLRKKLYVEKKGVLFMGDTPATLGQKLHQISGGFVKGEGDALHTFRENPKIQYIRDNFDPEKTIILSHYRAEQDALSRLFPHTGSTTRNSEGVDYSHFKDMVIYSIGHAGATYEQVRARQMNINRKWPIEVHFLIAGSIDQRVYDIASGKRELNKRWYE